MKQIRRHRSSNKYMRFHFEGITFLATTFMILNPGDIVTSASPPAGPIEPGHIIEAEVKKTGMLKNPVVGGDANLRYARDVGLASS